MYNSKIVSKLEIDFDTFSETSKLRVYVASNDVYDDVMSATTLSNYRVTSKCQKVDAFAD